MFTYLQLLRFRQRWFVLIGAAILLMGGVWQVAMGAPGDIERVSVSSAEAEGDGDSSYPMITQNGRFIAFESNASNLVENDTNQRTDVFLRDRESGETVRVSVASDGTEGNNISSDAFVSNNGRYVAFVSYNSNLVNDDTNNMPDVFVHDVQTKTTTRVSRNPNGTEGNVFSFNPTMSNDGRYIAFMSAANNLISNDNNNGFDIFVYDQQTNSMERISVDSNGVEGNSSSTASMISLDGRFVAFESEASNLVNNDANGRADIFVHDRQTGETRMASRPLTGIQQNERSEWPAISGNGRYVAFTSYANNLVEEDFNSVADIFVYDQQNDTVARVSVATDGTEANAASSKVSITANGRFVLFKSDATNLVAGDTNNAADLFIHDRQTGITERVSVGDQGTGVDFSDVAYISSGGHFIAFSSAADYLVANDTNQTHDIFVYQHFNLPEYRFFVYVPVIRSK